MASTREYTTAVTSGTSGSNLTSYSFTYHSSTNTNQEYAAVESITATYPTVTTGNNGSNAATTSSQYFYKDGTLGFAKDQNAIIGYREYTNGQLTKSIDDADTTLTAGGQDFNGISIPSGFSSSGSPIHWKTTNTFDAQGRLDATTLPNAMVKKHYYSKLGDSRLVHLAYNNYAAGGPTFYGPVSYTVTNLAGKAVVSATVGLTSNTSSTALTGHIDETDSDPITAMDLGTVKQMTTSIYSSPGTQLNESRAYSVVPGSGAGSVGTNYDKTLYGFDDAGHRWRVKEASGTISRTVFDKLGRATEQWIGTNDNSFAGGEGSPTDNMVKVHANIYDSGSDGGNSLLTTSTDYVQDSTTDQRVATYSYDLRGRLILATTPTAPYAFNKYDNLGRTLATGLYSSTASIDVDNDDPTSETTNRMALSETAFDEGGQVWKTTRHKITQSNGADADTITSQNWYDAAGRLVKTLGTQVSKTTFDRLGRATDSYTLIKDSDGSYSDSIAIRTNTSTGDYVAEEHHTYFDASGDAIMNWTVSRFHSDFDTGETRGLLDTNADADRRYVTFSDLKGRASIQTTFFDTTLHRVIDTVARGTNGDATYDRTSDSVAPSRADGRLRQTSVYNTDGTLQTIEDAKSLVTYFEYDAMGRKTKEVHNYNAGVNSGNPSGTADNQTITYAYSNGLMTTMTAVLPSSPTYDQVTTYTYGTTKGVSAGESKYATGHLLQKVTYPDDAGGNRGYVKYAYNAQGQLLWQEDQATNVLELVYDTAGRETIRKATTVAGGFDSAVLRIERAYDSLGRPTTVTQYDAASSGSVTDETKYAYDDWGPVSNFKIDKDSAISGGGNEYTVSYTYAKATNGRQTVRRNAIVLPSSKSISINYGTSPSHDDELSRVTNEKDSTIRLAVYEYNGVADVVGTTYAEANVKSVVYGSSPGTYDDLDTFGRITRSKWTTGSSKDFYKVEIGYDRNSNVAYVDDKVHTGFDALYTIDSLNRLTTADEGTRSGGTITSRTRKQEWTLSHTGNWDREKLDLDGNGSWGGANEHDDTRTHTKANEISTRDTDSNPASTIRSSTTSTATSPTTTKPINTCGTSSAASARSRISPTRSSPNIGTTDSASGSPGTRTPTTMVTPTPRTSGTTRCTTRRGGCCRSSGSRIAPQGGVGPEARGS